MRATGEEWHCSEGDAVYSVKRPPSRVKGLQRSIGVAFDAGRWTRLGLTFEELWGKFAAEARREAEAKLLEELRSEIGVELRLENLEGSTR